VTKRNFQVTTLTFEVKFSNEVPSFSLLPKLLFFHDDNKKNTDNSVCSADKVKESVPNIAILSYRKYKKTDNAEKIGNNMNFLSCSSTWTSKICFPKILKEN
jgi:hypothetical protein